MHEQISSNKRRSVLLVAGFVVLVALVALAVDRLLGLGVVFLERCVRGTEPIAEQPADRAAVAHQEPQGEEQIGDPDDHPTLSFERVGGGRTEDELGPEEPEEDPGLLDGHREVGQDGDREDRLGRGQEQLLALLGDDGQAVEAPGRDGEDDRQLRRAPTVRVRKDLAGAHGPRERGSGSPDRQRHQHSC